MYTDVLWEVYPVFLDAGYTPSLFWDSSMDEVIDLIDSARRRKKADVEQYNLEKKLEIQMLKVQAQQIVEYISLLLPGDDKQQRLTPLSKFYPFLFEDKENNVDKKQAEQQLALHKARMEDFMFWNNQKFKGGD